MNCSDIQELLSAYANGELPRLPGGPYEGAASAHFLKSGTSVLLGGTSEVAFDWEFIAPDSYHGTTTRDGLVQEFILVSDEQYTRDFAGTQSPGSVVIVTDNIYSPIPSREGTLRLLNSLTDVEQLPNERIGNVDTSHYLGRVDIHRILDEQLAALDPNAQGYQETLAFVDLQRTAQISIELWIDEEAYRIQQMKVDSQFPIIVSGPNGVEQQGSSGFSTVVRYSDFNSAIEIKRPLTASGNVIAGWRTVAHRSQRSSPVLSLRKRYVLLPLRTPGGFALGRDVGTKVLQVCAYSQVDSRRFRMDNFTLMLVGSGLATSGAISFRGSSVLAVRALAAGALAPGVIMLYVAVVNALSGT